MTGIIGDCAANVCIPVVVAFAAYIPGWKEKLHLLGGSSPENFISP